MHQAGCFGREDPAEGSSEETVFYHCRKPRDERFAVSTRPPMPSLSEKDVNQCAVAALHPDGPQQPKKVTGGAFGRFLAANRPALQMELAGKPSTKVVKLASERFNGLSESERSEWEKKYREAQAQYKKDMEAFLAAGGVKKPVKRKSREKIGAGDNKDSEEEERDLGWLEEGTAASREKNSESFKKQAKKDPESLKALGMRRFRVLAYPHLGLGLTLGKSYSAHELNSMCKGNEQKIKMLEAKLNDDKVFEPLKFIPSFPSPTLSVRLRQKTTVLKKPAGAVSTKQ